MLSEMSDAELAEFVALQEKYRDCGEPGDRESAEMKLRDLYAELEARARRNRFNVIAGGRDE